MVSRTAPDQNAAVAVRRILAYGFFFLVGVFIAVVAGGMTFSPGEGWGEYWMVAFDFGLLAIGLAAVLSIYSHDGLLYLLTAGLVLPILIGRGLLPTELIGMEGDWFLYVYSIGYGILCLTTPITATWITSWRWRLMLWAVCLVVVVALASAWDAGRSQFVWHWTTAADRQLLVAAAKGDLPAVEAALSDGADVDVRDDKGLEPLWLAAEKGHLQIVEMLLKGGADPYAAHDAPRPITALGIAAMRGHAAVVSAMLRSGIDPKNSKVADALVWAALSGQTEVVKILVAAGVDLDARNDEGLTNLEAAKKAAQTYSSTKTLEFLGSLERTPN